MNIVKCAISHANAISISKLMKLIFRFNSYSNIEKHILEVLVCGTASLFIILVTVI